MVQANCRSAVVIMGPLSFEFNLVRLPFEELSRKDIFFRESEAYAVQQTLILYQPLDVLLSSIIEQTE